MLPGAGRFWNRGVGGARPEEQKTLCGVEPAQLELSYWGGGGGQTDPLFPNLTLKRKLEISLSLFFKKSTFNGKFPNFYMLALTLG